MIYPTWLPPPLLYQPYQGNEQGYVEAAYIVFRADFIETRPTYNGKPVLFDGNITYHGKEEAFWHLISKSSSTTEQRIPDYERCERLPWVRPLIEAAGQNPEVLSWEQVRVSKRREKTTRTAILMPHERFAHILFLQERRNAYYLITSYYVSPGPKLNRYQNEYKEALKSKRPPLQ